MFYLFRFLVDFIDLYDLSKMVSTGCNIDLFNRTYIKHMYIVMEVQGMRSVFCGNETILNLESAIL